ncbi:MAG: type II secretion system minor pseudopilin GspH [Gammaproteobacteria bacterium]|nr:type II secretion system minor pseudopilin GspH [Gammaproteobacteria bacterium]NNC97372.1 type II secretion system minor pseudopilin GspH [Gammaproteobacteria bacterium]NNM13109.1 type II secretion system minor pseudopilin GspH [Gammaproteobacteria bacterium]
MSNIRSGFTLIEFLTVIVILAVVAGMVSIAIQGDPNRLLENSARKFIAEFNLVTEESALLGNEYGLQINDNAYRYLHWDQIKWQTPQDPAMATLLYFPDEITPELILDQNSVLYLETEDNQGIDFSENEKEIEPPQVLVLSSGEVTPFTLILRTVYNDDYISIDIDSLGRVKLTFHNEI